MIAIVALSCPACVAVADASITVHTYSTSGIPVVILAGLDPAAATGTAVPTVALTKKKDIKNILKMLQYLDHVTVDILCNSPTTFALC